jgi:hypothetical protein
MRLTSFRPSYRTRMREHGSIVVRARRSPTSAERRPGRRSRFRAGHFQHGVSLSTRSIGRCSASGSSMMVASCTRLARTSKTKAAPSFARQPMFERRETSAFAFGTRMRAVSRPIGASESNLEDALQCAQSAAIASLAQRNHRRTKKRLHIAARVASLRAHPGEPVPPATNDSERVAQS